MMFIKAVLNSEIKEHAERNQKKLVYSIYTPFEKGFEWGFTVHGSGLLKSYDLLCVFRVNPASPD